MEKGNIAQLSIYIPKNKADANVVERLTALGEKQDRSLNYLVVDAICQYLDREAPIKGAKASTEEPTEKPEKKVTKK